MMNDMFNVANPASPFSPLNPLNPLNPASPLNPIHQTKSEPTPPEPRDYHESYQQFDDDLGKIARGAAAAWLTGQPTEDVTTPDGATLKRTADGFSMQVVRQGMLGPSRTVDYLYDKEKLTLDVRENSLKGPVREFFSGQPKTEHYTLNLFQNTVQEHKP